MDIVSLKLTIDFKKRKTHLAKNKIMYAYTTGKEIIVLIENHLFFVGRITGMTFFAPSKETVEMNIMPSGTLITDENFPKNISKNELTVYEPLTMNCMVITSMYDMIVR